MRSPLSNWSESEPPSQQDLLKSAQAVVKAEQPPLRIGPAGYQIYQRTQRQ